MTIHRVRFRDNSSLAFVCFPPLVFITPCESSQTYEAAVAQNEWTTAVNPTISLCQTLFLLSFMHQLASVSKQPGCEAGRFIALVYRQSLFTRVTWPA